MATRASHGKAEEGAACGADHIVQFVGALVCGQDRVWAFDLVPWATDDEPCGGVFSKDIASQLLTNELIVRFVFVERTDHVVAIAPGGRARLVHFETMCFSEAHHVEPVPSPAFTELRRREN